MSEKKEYVLLDFPEIKGKFKSSSPGKAAEKIFNRLINKLKFTNNMNGSLYLVFHIKEVNDDNPLPYIGTVIKLQNPINYKRGTKNIEIDHRVIVSKYDSKMKKVFRRLDS